jgi:PPOX class probable F420-dependent enzyme
VVRLPDSARAIVESSALAHLATINHDGSPQVTCIWLGLDGDELVSAHLFEQQKLKNVARDPRVTISIEAPPADGVAMRHYLVIHGLARITAGGAPELLQQLAYTYVGPGVTFPPMPNPPPGFIMHTTVERIGGQGPWAS